MTRSRSSERNIRLTPFAMQVKYSDVAFRL